MRYLEVGSGQPLVLLHAFPLSADQWLPQLARGATGNRMIAPDLRGFRGTGPAFEDGALEGISMDDYAADVLALMTHLDIDRAIVVGASMGGYVAFAMLRRAPTRVAGLVLANTRAIPDSADGRAGRDRLIAAVRRDGPDAVVREMLPKLLGVTTQREQPDLVEAVERLMRLNGRDALVAGLSAMRDRPDCRPLLAGITCPTTVIAGAEDAIIPPAEPEAMHASIPSSRLVRLAAVGHLANLEAAAEFSKILAPVPTALRRSGAFGGPAGNQSSVS